VRKHTLEHQARHGCAFETAALRVFSNAEGAYGANVNQMIEGGVWADPDELANAFESNKGFAYGVSGKPVQQRDLLQSALGTVDFTYQNLESIELGINDVDQYVDGLGGVTRSVARAKGAETPVYILDATRGATKVRTLAEQIDLEARTRTLNPKWFEGLLQHGYEGVRQIEGHVTSTLGWSATTGQVAPWVYQKISETFVLDAEMRRRLSELNPGCLRPATAICGLPTRQRSLPCAKPMTSWRTASKACSRRNDQGILNHEPAQPLLQLHAA
jgi:magnesium chelatase subunit H